MFTVCDDAADEFALVARSAHDRALGSDPSMATGNEAERAFCLADAHRMLNQRIGIFVSLPLRSLSKPPCKAA